MRNLGAGGDIRNRHQRVAGAFDPHQACLGRQLPGERLEIGAVGQRHADCRALTDLCRARAAKGGEPRTACRSRCRKAARDRGSLPHTCARQSRARGAIKYTGLVQQCRGSETVPHRCRCRLSSRHRLRIRQRQRQRMASAFRPCSTSDAPPWMRLLRWRARTTPSIRRSKFFPLLLESTCLGYQ